LLKGKLEKFLAKRALIFFIILAFMDIVFIGQRWIVLTGLFVGLVISVLKLDITGKIYSRVLGIEGKFISVSQSMLIYVLIQILVVILLAVAIKLSVWLFFGATTGVLLVPCVILVNSLTETLRITHNNFE
jgi:hypothetical protein